MGTGVEPHPGEPHLRITDLKDWSLKNKLSLKKQASPADTWCMLESENDKHLRSTTMTINTCAQNACMPCVLALHRGRCELLHSVKLELEVFELHCPEQSTHPIILYEVGGLLRG